jgi:hypothetical protein
VNPQRQNRPPFLSRKLVLTAAALIVWSFFLWRGIDVFKPGVYSGVVFNSDCAVPVLMANDNRPITLFNFYYYGHDRWGGWPFLGAQIIRRLTNHQWTAQNLSTGQTIWLFVGGLIISALSRRDWIVITFLFLVSVCVLADAGHLIFFLSHVYAWQVTALFLSWSGLRRLLDHSRPNEQPRRRVVWLIVTFLFSYLAIWSSISSAPFLLFLVGLESVRAYLKSDGARHNSFSFRSLLTGLTVVVAAIVGERLQVMLYHRSAMRSFGVDFRTPLGIDFGFLFHNVGVQSVKLATEFSRPLFFTLIATVAAAFASFYCFRTRSAKSREIFRGHGETCIIAFGAYGIALINFVLAVATTHVRINEYDDRFLLLTNVFGTFSGLLALFLAIDFAVHKSQLRRHWTTAFLLLTLIFLAITFPRKIYRPEYESFQDAALTLMHTAPRAVLLGDYWAVYVFAALQPANGITPVPFEGQQNRMPWTREIVRNTTGVLLQYPGSKLEESARPSERLSQYGNQFQLAEPRVYDNGVFAFARYIKAVGPALSDETTKIKSLLRQTHLQIVQREPRPDEMESFVSRSSDCHADDACIEDRIVNENLTLLRSDEFQNSSGFIYPLYRIALGRAPNYWEWERDRKQINSPGKDVMRDFIEAWTRQTEFSERYPGSLNNGQYVERLCEMAGQVTNESQRAQWVNALNTGGMTRAGALWEIVSRSRLASADNEAFVTLCYFIYLKRDPDTGGLNHWVQVAKHGPDGAMLVVRGFLNSGEYRAKFPRP